MFSTITWLLSIGGGAVAAIAALYFIPALQPIVKWSGETLPKLGEYLKEGIANIFDKAPSIVVLLSLIFGAYTYGTYSNKEYWKDKAIKELRQDYTFVKKRR